MDLHRTTTDSMLQLHRAGLLLAARALSRSDRLIAATPSFDEEREASGAHIAASIERERRRVESEETAIGFDIDPIDVEEPAAGERTTVIMSGPATDRLTDRAMVEEMRDALTDAAWLFDQPAHHDLASDARRITRQIKAVLAKAAKYLEPSHG
jgi:hypothetical protein